MARQVNGDDFDSKLQGILAAGRIVRPAPDVIRARGLARARAAVAAASQQPLPMTAGWSHRLRVAVAASVALLLGAAGAVAALRVRLPEKLAPAPSSRRRSSGARGSPRFSRQSGGIGRGIGRTAGQAAAPSPLGHLRCRARPPSTRAHRLCSARVRGGAGSRGRTRTTVPERTPGRGAGGHSCGVAGQRRPYRGGPRRGS